MWNSMHYTLKNKGSKKFFLAKQFIVSSHMTSTETSERSISFPSQKKKNKICKQNASWCDPYTSPAAVFQSIKQLDILKHLALMHQNSDIIRSNSVLMMHTIYRQAGKPRIQTENSVKWLSIFFSMLIF